MKRLSKLLIALSITLCFIGNIKSGYAIENIIKNDESGIPDSNLYAVALEAGDTNRDGILTTDEALTINNISIYESKNDINLKGLSYFKNLTYLYLSGYDEELTENERHAIINFGEIEYLDNLTSLTMQRLDGIDTPYLSDLTLNTLQLTNTNVNNLNFINDLSSLKELRIDDCIKDKSAISNMHNLQTLSITENYDNNISNSMDDIDFTNLTNLKSLSIGYSNNIDFSKLTSLSNLTSLSLYGNFKSDVLLDFSNFHNLSILTLINKNDNDLIQNRIVNIDSLSDSLTYLSFGGNYNNFPSLTGFNNLNYVSISNSNITNIDFLTDTNNIENMHLYNNKSLSNIDPVVNMKKIEYLYVLDCNLSTLPNMKDLSELTFNEDPSITNTRFNGNHLTKEELISKLPDKVLNYPNWLEYNSIDETQQPVDPEPTKTIELDCIEINDNEVIKYLNDDTTEKIIINLSNSDVLSSDVIKALKDSKKNLTINVFNQNDGELAYSWTINGEWINQSIENDLSLDIKFETEKQQEIESITNQSNMFYLNFAHHGNLPGSTNIKVDVSDKFNDGDILYLYHYNEDSQTIEKISSGIEVIDGYAKININHCSTYFFTENEVTVITEIPNKVENTNNQNLTDVNEQTSQVKSVKTSDDVQLIMPTIGFILSLIAISCFFMKKRKA